MVFYSDQFHSTPASQRRLFALPEDRERMTQPPPIAPSSDPPRLRLADRRQVGFRACCWNDLLPDDHQARIVWNYVKEMDLSPLLAEIKSVQGNAGHPATDPRILVALWFYATLRAVGSARELARRCGESGEIPFQWICGGVTLNYHTLADFRVEHVEFLDQFLTDSVAVLREQELVTLDRSAQDGMKVRASAGAASFRRKPTLEEHLAEARQQIQALKEELQTDPAAGNARQRAARERAVREREERLRQAIEQHAELEAQRKTAEKKENARASTTDPEARVMKMADGGFRPAYNVQLATDTQTQIITGVDVTNSGGDQGKLAPMVEQHQERYGETPDEMLVDGGFVKKEDIVAVSPPNGSTTVYAPVQVSKSATRDAHEPRPDDKPAVAEWRQRMATDEAKEIYKERAATAECVNAIARNRGLQQFRVRGKPKVRAVILWYVLAHNLLRAVALRAAATQTG
jgi:transposase